MASDNNSDNEDLNPGDKNWDSRFDSSGQLKKLEQSGSGADSLDGDSNDLGDKVRDGETTNGGWADNVTGKSSGGGRLQKSKLIFKKRASIGVLIALLGGGAAIPFLSSAALPFSIIGNMDSKSMMHGLTQYADDYYGFRIFGGKKGSVQGSGSKLQGLHQSEIDQLRAKGVKVETGGKTKTGKISIKSISYAGQTANNATSLKSTMRSNTAFRKAMVFNKGSYWKSSKSAMAAKVKSKFKIKANVDISGKDQVERNKKLQTASVESDGPNSVSSGTTDPNSENAETQNQAQDATKEMNDDIEAKKKLVDEGKYTSQMGADSNMGNLGSKLSKQAGAAVDSGMSLSKAGGAIWGFVNVLDPLDTVCTAYQAANIANVMARTVVVANIIRFAMTIRVNIEKVKAEGDKDGTIEYLMNMIQRKDPETGQSFDQTSYASFLFSGQLSSEPNAVSALGGQAMIALGMSLHALHYYVGGGNAANGRSLLKQGCGIVTNVGVQIGATALSFFASIFSAGGASAAVQAVKSSAGLIIKEGVAKVSKEVAEKIIQKVGAKAIGEKLTGEALKNGLRTMSKKSWSIFKSEWGSMSWWVKSGFVIAGVSYFGMDYIVDALAGADIAGFMMNGFSAFDALGTGWDKYESSSALASGGTVATYAQATAYQSTQDEYSNSYIADMKYDALSTPLDIDNPYSQLGSAIYGIQKIVGVSDSMNLVSAIKSVALLPFNLPFIPKANADASLSPQAIGQKIGDEFYIDSKITTTVTGSPRVIFKKNYTLEEILSNLVDNDQPQMTLTVPGADDNPSQNQTTDNQPVDPSNASNPQVPQLGSDPKQEPKLEVIDSAPEPKSGVMNLKQYIDICHNPDKTEINPEFTEGTPDGSIDEAKEYTGYSMAYCMPSGSHYNSEYYPMYDDAIRFMTQINPDSAQSGDKQDDGGYKAPVSGMPFKSGVYTANKPALVTNFESQRGAKSDVYTVFPTRDSWTELHNTWYMDSKYYPTSNDKANIVIGVPLWPKDGSLSDASSGKYDGEWKKFAEEVSKKFPNAYIRLGWEMNIPDFYYHMTESNATEWNKAFKQAVTVMKKTAPGFKIVWNPNDDGSTIKDMRSHYPGNEFVDVIGIDAYDWSPPYTSQGSIDNHLGAINSWNNMLAFAKSNGKKFALPEWGLSHGSDAGGDNPQYINFVYDWLSKNRNDIEFETYFNEPESYIQSDLFVSHNPKGSDAYKAKITELISSTNGNSGGGSSPGMPPNAIKDGPGWKLKPGQDYSNIACAPGASDSGLTTNQATGIKVRICTIKGMPVASVISKNVLDLIAAAKGAGINITISSGLRTYEKQAQLYAQNCSGGSCRPPTARPGTSNHESGTAIDWGLNGMTFCYPSSSCPSGANKGYDWFMKNAKTYGFYKLPSEAWHWSTNAR